MMLYREVLDVDHKSVEAWIYHPFCIISSLFIDLFLCKVLDQKKIWYSTVPYVYFFFKGVSHFTPM
jgi:hypothetical protein